MLSGSFDPATGRPFLEGLPLIPELRLQGVVSFLIDTGSDLTCLMPTDGVSLGVDYDKLPAPGNAVNGIGGRVVTSSLPAVVAFAEHDGTVRYYWVDLHVHPDTPELEKLPSLLGRNIIDRWRMDYDPTENRLQFEVRSADVTRS